MILNEKSEDEESYSDRISSDDSGSILLEDDVPAIIKPIPPMERTLGNAYIRPLDDMIMDISKEEDIQYTNFSSKNQMKKYENDDYRVKAFISLITGNRRKKIWMPGKTVFDKRGGKYSEKVAGLGQIPGL